MVNYVSREQAWDFLADIACQPALAMMPVGCPVVVADRHLLDELPDNLRDDAVVIASGSELLGLVRST
jgi:hypothetical protein